MVSGHVAAHVFKVKKGPHRISVKRRRTKAQLIDELGKAWVELDRLRARIKEMEDSRHAWEAKMNAHAARQEPVRILRDFVRTLEKCPLPTEIVVVGGAETNMGAQIYFITIGNLKAVAAAIVKSGIGDEVVG